MKDNTLIHRKAEVGDLKSIIELLKDDELGQAREVFDKELDSCYFDAFKMINDDPNQYLMVIEMNNNIIGTCHLTIVPSLTYKGSSRLQIEAVRVLKKHRKNGIGTWMINEAIKYAGTRGASIIQLSMNKQRQDTIKFYEGLGFKATHEGMKLFRKEGGI
ncbi:MAG: GNAT family N-acetyltransferase [Alphaproteobacteria bacterium]|nr:GNAT family N-acetyltransferase [Alphaproteobacteria bacterium]